jgi:2-polyprenyl-6-hydroxyphenyl methylase/3-demethylubiquinone-9 3-methyltransferase
VGDLGTFDVVISWGVLHHTGKLWNAIDTAASMVSPGGRLWIALYHRTTKSGRSLRIKRLYNSLPKSGKWLMRTAYGSQLVAKAVVRDRGLQRLRGYDRERGMSWRRDIEDWLGGLPYEVSSPGEVIARLNPAGFTLSRLLDAEGEAGNDVYLFDRRRGDTLR